MLAARASSKSLDGGSTWTHVNSGLGNHYVGSLFMHPTDPDILLAGTGNNQYHDGGGVYRTGDGGGSWQKTLSDVVITAVEIAQADPTIAYAGGTDAMYRSEDGGLTWTQTAGGSDGTVELQPEAAAIATIKNTLYIAKLPPIRREIRGCSRRVLKPHFDNSFARRG